MQLETFSFTEFANTDRVWSVNNFRLDAINLFVGRNSSGKSRIVTVISVLGALINQPPEQLWEDGSWDCSFIHKKKKYKLSIKLRNRQIYEESLSIDGSVKLQRGVTGEGFIWADKLNQAMEFKVPENKLVLHSRRDEIQHGFLEPLFLWAKSVRKYAFGTEFGKATIYAAPADFSDTASDDASVAANPDHVIKIYIDGYKQFGERFDKAILKDFKKVGYDCTDVRCGPLENITVAHLQQPQLLLGRLPMSLWVKERDLPGITRQHEMSMGMYRALALIINMNYTLMSINDGSILVDDIGEGLDFERSVALIKILMSKCKREGIQLSMSTNDRFVMNEVDLKFWHVVHRTGPNVEILDYHNSKEKFDQFKFLGLSNFDFFSREGYLEKIA